MSKSSTNYNKIVYNKLITNSVKIPSVTDYKMRNSDFPEGTLVFNTTDQNVYIYSQENTTSDPDEPSPGPQWNKIYRSETPVQL